MGKDNELAKMLEANKASGGDGGAGAGAGGADGHGPARTDTDGVDVGSSDGGIELSPDDVLESIEWTEIDVVSGGAVQRLKMVRSDAMRVDPSKTLERLRMIDPGIKVRDEFPMRRSFNRDTKPARVTVVMIQGGNFQKIELVCDGMDADGKPEQFKVVVSRRNIDGFGVKLRALGRLPEDVLERIVTAISGKTDCVFSVPPDTQFGLTYSTADDKTRYLEELTVDPPAVEAVVAADGAAPSAGA